MSNPNDLTIRRRVERCDQLLKLAEAHDLYDFLVDLLADAMHWCDAHGEDFHYMLVVACTHYHTELNEEEPHGRRTS